MTDQIRFDDKVVLITGAGNGLGRAYALLFGARGAKVVVNDLGGGRHGDGKSSAAADKVVEEIHALGGQAVASFDSVEDGDKIAGPDRRAQARIRHAARAWLCHESCAETGGLFEVGASYCSKLRWERTRGHLFGAGRGLSPEELAAKWDSIVDFAAAEHPTSIDDTFTRVMAAAKSKTLGGNEFIDLDTASAASTTVESAYDERDLALYALGVGAAADAVDEKELAFVSSGARNSQLCPRMP